MNKKKTLLLAFVLVGLFMVGSTLAFLTDTKSATNTFTIGNVAIDLLEPNWDENNAKNITPKAKVAKDPQIVNKGVNDAYVFLTVEVPKVLVDEETTTKELFTFAAKTADWYLVPDAGSETENSKMYVYAYGTTSAMTKLAKDVTTSPLFEEVELIDFDSLGTDVNTSQNINVTAYAIQADNIGATTPTDVWNVIKTEFTTLGA